MIAMVNAYRSGDPRRACEWHHKLFPLCRDMLGLATNPIPVKGAMRLLGRDSGEMRLPMTPLDERGLAFLRRTLIAYGLLEHE
jgi:4-hydroxy-tetrahydrodipicolinate synthase